MRPICGLSYTHKRAAATRELKSTGRFSEMDLQTDEDEHSIEMHLPYVRKVFEGYIFTTFFVFLSS